MNKKPNPNTMDYKKLHEHILQEHDLFLFEDEIKEIVRVVLKITDNKLDVIDDYPLFEYMDKYYGITLLESQMREIIDIVLKMHNEKSENCTTETAMQELIAQLKERRSNMREAYKPLRHLQYVNDQMNMLIHQITIDIEWAELMLEKEKQMLEKAYMDGYQDSTTYNHKGWDK